MIDEQKFLPLKRFVHKGLRSLMGSLGEKEARYIQYITTIEDRFAVVYFS